MHKIEYILNCISNELKDDERKMTKRFNNKKRNCSNWKFYCLDFIHAHTLCLDLAQFCSDQKNSGRVFKVFF